MITAQSLSEAFDHAKQGREQSMVKCPAHDDGSASLHVAPGDRQPVVMTCHAGCENNDILQAAGISLQEMMGEKELTELQPQNRWTPQGNASHVYPYYDENGVLLYEVMRIPLPEGKKSFRQRTPNPIFDSSLPRVKGDKRCQEYLWNLEGVRRVLYRLPEVLAAVLEGRTVFVVEGEKDVESLRSKGETATTSPMGAGKWRDEYTESLKGAHVIVIPDTDKTGRDHGRKVVEDLRVVAQSVRMFEPHAGCKDITDHLEAGYTMEQLIETAPGETEKSSYGIDILSAIQRTFSQDAFVIPGTLSEGERLLLTGFEGHGKSTLLRQLAVQVAAGIHPFTLAKIPPKRVLFIDVENHPSQVIDSWQQLVGLAGRSDAQIDEGMLTIMEEWDTGIDLTVQSGYDYLIERIHGYKPHLVCMGPLYNMSDKDLKDDETVRKIKKVVNDARGLYGTAFIMEHHAPHRSATDKERSVRPYGSSTFLKWPDFGYGLRPLEQQGTYEWQKTRFPRVRTRIFPTHLRWGTPNSAEWPWMPASEDSNGNII